MKIEEAQTSFYDVLELACIIIGLDYDEIEGDTGIIDQKLIEELNIDIDGFHKIINRLLPLITVSKSPLTNVIYKGFANRNEKIWLVKTPVE